MKTFIQALRLAAMAHAGQFRKDGITPYINHPIEVVRILSDSNICNEDILSAAILHDVIEDTRFEYCDLQEDFGSTIANIVYDCTDDKSLPKEERKRLQVIHASKISYEARLVKLADKIANMTDILLDPPIGWSKERRLDYFEWAKEVVDAGLHGDCEELDCMFNTCYDLKKYLLT
jgi:guanosine-3',5'-bis(diphosphate) 3'-pyrophosphohydrolase